MHAVKHVDVATVSNLCKHTEPSPANKPRPCVIRGAGNEMDLVKKLSYNNHKSRACIETYSDTNNNKSTPEAEKDDDNNQSLPADWFDAIPCVCIQTQITSTTSKIKNCHTLTTSNIYSGWNRPSGFHINNIYVTQYDPSGNHSLLTSRMEFVLYRRR